MALNSFELGAAFRLLHESIVSLKKPIKAFAEDAAGTSHFALKHTRGGVVLTMPNRRFVRALAPYDARTYYLCVFVNHLP